MSQIKALIFAISVLVATSMVAGPGPPENPGNGGGGPPSDCPGKSCERGNKDKEAPTIQINQSENKLRRGNTNNLTVNVVDNHNISNVYLLTNESGVMERKTAYGSPKTVFKKEDNLSFNWSNFSVKNRSIGWKVFANDTNGNARNSSVKHFEAFSEPGFRLNSLDLKNQSSITEGEEVELSANLSNNGTASSNLNLSLRVETYEGSGYVQKNQILKNLEIGVNESREVDFSWTAKPGPYRFTINTASENHSLESKKSVTVNVPSHQVYYGNSNIEVRLSSGEEMFYRFDSKNSKGRIYFSDYDSDYLFSDLQPLNNLSEVKIADEALKLEGHNDSLQKLLDRDGKGDIDSYQQIEVGQRSLLVPVFDSTSSGGFKTGILYDSDESKSYDGSQDIVIVTPLKNNFEGKFGLYDYETKVPFSLESQTGQTDKISIYTELE